MLYVPSFCVSTLQSTQFMSIPFRAKDWLMVACLILLAGTIDWLVIIWPAFERQSFVFHPLALTIRWWQWGVNKNFGHILVSVVLWAVKLFTISQHLIGILERGWIFRWIRTKLWCIRTPKYLNMGVGLEEVATDQPIWVFEVIEVLLGRSVIKQRLPVVFPNEYKKASAGALPGCSTCWNK